MIRSCTQIFISKYHSPRKEPGLFGEMIPQLGWKNYKRNNLVWEVKAVLKMIGSLSIFYCCPTNYHKLNSLKNSAINLLAYSSVGQKPSLTCKALCSEYPKLKSRCQRGCLVLKALGKNPLTRAFILFVGWVQTLEVVGLRSLLLCWLATGTHSQLLLRLLSGLSDGSLRDNYSHIESFPCNTPLWLMSDFCTHI